MSFFFHQGSIIVEGSYQKLQTSGLDFTKLLGPPEYDAAETESDSKNMTTNNLDPFPITFRKNSTLSVSSSNLTCKTFDDHSELIEMKKNDSPGENMPNLYFSYISAGGNVYKITFLLFMFVITQVLASGADFWIMFW